MDLSPFTEWPCNLGFSNNSARTPCSHLLPLHQEKRLARYFPIPVRHSFGAPATHDAFPYPYDGLAARGSQQSCNQQRSTTIPQPDRQGAFGRLQTSIASMDHSLEPRCHRSPTKTQAPHENKCSSKKAAPMATSACQWNRLGRATSSKILSVKTTAGSQRPPSSAHNDSHEIGIGTKPYSNDCCPN